MHKKWYHLALSIIILSFSLSAFFSSFFLPDDQDGVNYLFGVENYDISFHRPHFPGYPVYIALGKLLTYLTPSPEYAMVLLSVLSGAGSLLLIYLLTEKITSDPYTALISTLFLSVHPIFFEFSHKIFSEIPALFLLLLSIYALGDPNASSKKRWVVSGFIAGLMLGVRLSWWPYPLVYLAYSYKKKAGLYFFSGIVIGISLWLILQVEIVGMGELFKTGVSFTSGHFTIWGGAIKLSDGIVDRVLLFLSNIIKVCGFIGIPVLSLAYLSFIIFSIVAVKSGQPQRVAPTDIIKYFLWAGLIYLLWVALGQNSAKVRHYIPVLPLLIFILSLSIKRYPKAAMGVLILTSFNLPLSYILRDTDSPPVVQFQMWVNSLDRDAVFYCGQSERFFDRYPATARVVNVPAFNSLPGIIKSTWPKSDHIFICDDITGFHTDKAPLMTFHARYGDPVDYDLMIYRYLATD